MNESHSSRRVLRTWLTATTALISLSGCAITQPARTRTLERQMQEQRDYYLSLIYSQAPELRHERLVLLHSSWGGTPPRGNDIRTAQSLEARFRFERDGDAAYRFVRVERRWLDPARPPKVTVTTGRERATHITEEHPYRRKSQ